MKVAELFASVQGEGSLTGTPSVFVRTSGCNLRCWFCDTPYTSWKPEGELLTVDQILRRIEQLLRGNSSVCTIRHAVLTGGEPLLQPELVPLAHKLHAAGWHITVETAGTCYLDLPCDLMSISPKRANSTPTRERSPGWNRRHAARRHQPAVLRQLFEQYPYQLKFVVDQPADIDDVLAFLAEFPEVTPSQVWLMPQGTSSRELAERSAWLAPRCDQLGMHFCPRQHIAWFGYLRGT